MTDVLHAGGCPTDEQLAAYAEGLLSGEERLAVERHLAECETCREIVAEAVRLQAEPLPARVLPFWKRPKVRAMGGGVLALAASLILVVQLRPELNPFRRPTPYEELVAAVGTNRTVEGRLSGGFQYGPFRSETRSGPGDDVGASYPLLAAAARIQAMASENPTAENLRALGVAELALGRYDDAISVLERGAEGADSARFNSDLSAAYLERGRRTANPEDYARALTAAERAIRGDSSLPEAYFNRALALERLHLSEAAQKAWEEALQKDPHSAWAEEIGRRARPADKSSRITREEFMSAVRSSSWERVDAVLESDAQFPREIVEDDLLPAWAGAIAEDRSGEAEVALATVHNLVRRASERHKDPLLQATIEHVESARAVSARLQQLARGHLEYSRGRSALRENEDAAAARWFAAASRHLKQAGSPFYLWADFHTALLAYYERDIDRADAMSRALEAATATEDYAALFGRVQWLRGLLAITVGRYGDALAHYHRALSAFDRQGDREHRAAVGYLLAEVHMNLGDRRAAWTRLAEALALRADIRDAWRRHTLLLMAGVICNRSGWFDAALAFQKLLVDEAAARGNAAAQTEAYLQRAVTLAGLGERDAASHDVQAAYAVSRTVADTGLRQSLETDVMLADGEVRLTLGDPEAVHPLDAVVPRLRRERYASRLGRVLLARARANLLNRNEKGAEADLEEGIALVDDLRSGLTQSNSRLRYSDRVWDLYDQMASLHIRHGRPALAQEFVDRARARFVAESLGPARRLHPIDMEHLQQLVQPGAALLSYLVVDAAVGVWVVTRTLNQWVQLPIQPTDLRDAVGSYVKALGRVDDRRTRELGATLYDSLLAPLERETAGVQRLIIVPHDVLNQLPFATLFDRSPGQYVVERQSIVVVPSLLLFASFGEQVRHPRSAHSVLAVGDPAVNAAGLSRLPHAAREVLDVSRLYPRGRVLTDAAATRAAVVNLLGSHDILHFAGHAVASAEAPDLSRLMLAPSPDGDAGALYLRDVLRLGLRNIQLVVLSACRTADGAVFRGEGAVTLSSAFLGAGVPRVVGTLWDVPDEASAEISVAFHRDFASGVDHDVALRNAQLTLLRHANPSMHSPSAWGAFQSFGMTAS